MRNLILATYLAFAASATSYAQPAQLPYIQAKSIPLPDGRWDLLSVEPTRHRIMIARGDSVTIVDQVTGQTRSIGKISRGHGVVSIGGDLIAVTSGGDNTVRLIDAVTGEQTASIDVGDNPDAALYDAASKRLIIMNAKGGSVSVIDAQASRVVRTIQVKPALELGVMIGPDLIAINDEDANEIELVDLKRGAALKPVPLPGCEGPTGIAFDATDGLLLSACANEKAALVDVKSRTLIRVLPIGAGADGALFDSTRHRFLVPSGKSGTLSVFAVGPGRQVRVLPAITTASGARTAAIDLKTGWVFLPVADFSPAVGNVRGAAVPGSARLLVLKPSGS